MAISSSSASSFPFDSETLRRRADRDEDEEEEGVVVVVVAVASLDVVIDESVHEVGEADEGDQVLEEALAPSKGLDLDLPYERFPRVEEHALARRTSVEPVPRVGLEAGLVHRVPAGQHRQRVPRGEQVFPADRAVGVEHVLDALMVVLERNG